MSERAGEPSETAAVHRAGVRTAAVVAAVLVVLAVAGVLLWPSPPAAATLHSGTAHYLVDATVDPPRRGDATVTVDLGDRDGAAPHAAVRVQAVMPLMGLATPPLPAGGNGQRSGHYTVTGVPLMMTGPWELHVAVTGHDGATEDLTLPFTVSG